MRALGEAFLATGDSKALLLPRLAAIGDVDEDELVLTGSAAALDTELPPAIDPMARSLLLARLVEARGDLTPSPAAALKLAEALAELLDAIQIEEVGFDAFANLVPDDYARHWGQTLAFLEILRDAWPRILAGRGQMDPQARRVKLVRALAAHWQANPPGPICPTVRSFCPVSTGRPTPRRGKRSAPIPRTRNTASTSCCAAWKCCARMSCPGLALPIGRARP